MLTSSLCITVNPHLPDGERIRLLDEGGAEIGTVTIRGRRLYFQFPEHITVEHITRPKRPRKGGAGRGGR